MHPNLKKTDPESKFSVRILKILAVAVLGMALGTGMAWGFALGPMEVKSEFGERFNAEIEMQVDKGKPTRVFIGGPQDYARMGVARPSVVDELIIPGAAEISEGRQIIRVISPLPLFYPSFNLILRAEQGSNVIMENYLVTVDFRQSVSLSIKAERPQDRIKKKQEAEASEPESLTPAEQTAEVPEEPQMSGDKSEEVEEGASGSPSVVVAVHPAPLVVRELPEPAEQEIEPLPTPAPVPMETTPPVAVPAPPQAPVAEKKPEAPPEAVAVVAKAPSPEPVEEKVEPVSPPDNVKKETHAPVVVSREVYGPLRRGESLASVITELKMDPVDSRKAAVALWMDNRDKFIKGNIHGLESGVELNLTSLNARLAEVTTTRANWTIENHWQEWEAINDRLKLASQIDLDPNLAMIMMPMGRKEEQAAVYQLVDEWRGSWEKGELEKHLALFSSKPREEGIRRGFDYWKRFKKMMFRRHERVQIRITPPVVVRMQDRIAVGFDQWFDSSRMRSFGRKTLELVREGTDWKIENERFAVKRFLNKVKAADSDSGTVTEADFSMPESLMSPLVIHAATIINPNQAVEAVNALRSAGHPAYLSPLYVTPTKKVYRVLVGRASDWNGAEALTRQIRKVNVARFAAPKRFAYALKVGEFLEPDKAEALAGELLAKGISSYLLSGDGGNFPNPVIQVLVGGFLEKESAERYRQELSDAKIVSEVVMP